MFTINTITTNPRSSHRQQPSASQEITVSRKACPATSFNSWKLGGVGVLGSSAQVLAKEHLNENDRGYLAQILVDCYGISRVFLVERKSYKLKADRSLRQKEDLTVERLRIDIEDLNLNAVRSLRGMPYLAVGKHLCEPATDLTLRCCLNENYDQDNGIEQSFCQNLRGIAVATCCHHLCQWNHYTNSKIFDETWFTKEEFHISML